MSLAILKYLARQVGIAQAAWNHFAWQGRTIEYHHAQIREFPSFREATVEDAEALASWLVEHILLRNYESNPYLSKP